MKYKTLLVDITDRILTVTLNRPDKRNALNALLVYELTSVFDQKMYVRDVSIVNIKGAGTSFCAGADLGYLKSIQNNTIDEHKVDSDNLLEMYKRIYNYPRPVIALVNGPAIGGGCGLANC